VCCVVKDYLPWKRGEHDSKTREVKNQKCQTLPEEATTTIAHRSLIQVNTVRYDAAMPQQAQAGVSELSEYGNTTQGTKLLGILG